MAAPGAHAAELHPTTTADVAGAGGMSLRDAVAAAARPGYDAITLPAGQRFVLSDCEAGPLTVPRGDTLVIYGSGASVVQACPGQPVFSVSGVAYLRRVALSSQGGAPAPLVRTDGLLWMRDATLSGSPGAGVECQECVELVAINSHIVANAGGGVVARSRTRRTLVVLRGTEVAGNRSALPGAGLGAELADPASAVWIEDSTVTTNVTTGDAADGGGVDVAAPSLDVTGSRVSGNVAGSEERPGSGGGISFRASGAGRASASVASSVVSGNAASFAGGGVSVSGDAQLALIESTVSSNTAAAQGGGVAIQSSRAGTLLVDGSTITGNVAGQGSGGGGISLLGTSSTSAVVRSTLIGNRAGRGGGIDAGDDSGLALQRSTLVRNASPRGANVAVSGRASVTTLADIVAQPAEGDSCLVAPGATLSSGGYSVFGDASCVPSATDRGVAGDVGVGDLPGPDAAPGRLPAIAAVAPASAAVGVVPGALCVGMRDQAGRSREGERCTAGAVEPVAAPAP